MCGDDNVNIFEYCVPCSLVSPSIDTIVSTKHFYAILWKLRSKDLELLFA